MTVKLIALDMDGTTLNNEGKISGRNRKTLEKAAAKGVNIVIATGRPRSALPKDVLEIGAIRYALTSNGARITDLAEGKTIYENCMSPLAAERSVELLRNYHYVIECFIDGVAYIDKWYYDEVKQSGESFRSVSYILNTRNPRRLFSDLFQAGAADPGSFYGDGQLSDSYKKAQEAVLPKIAGCNGSIRKTRLGLHRGKEHFLRGRPFPQNIFPPSMRMSAFPLIDMNIHRPFHP